MSKWFDVTANFLVQAANEEDARNKVINFVTNRGNDVQDWDVTEVELNNHWEIGEPKSYIYRGIE